MPRYQFFALVRPDFKAGGLSACDSREEALLQAHTESGLTMSAIAKELGLSISRVSRLIVRAEGAKGKA